MFDHENDDIEVLDNEDDQLDQDDDDNDVLDDGEPEDELEDAEEEDRGPGWYERNWAGPEDDEIECTRSEMEDFEYEEGGGIVTDIPLPARIGTRRYQNICWDCKQNVDDVSLPRCSGGCGWVRCGCGSCLCNMPIDRRLKRPFYVKVKHITAAKCICSACRGVCFVANDRERGRQQELGQSYSPTVAEYWSCNECSGLGYRQSRKQV